MVYLAVGYGGMLLAVLVGLFLVAWRDRSLAKGAFAFVLFAGYSWCSYVVIVGIGNHPD